MSAIPDNCPEPLKSVLAQHDGNRTTVAELLGVTTKTIQRWVSKEAPIPAPRIEELRALLPHDAPAVGPAPVEQIVPWQRSVAIRLAKARQALGELPEPLGALMDKFQNNQTALATALAVTPAYLHSILRQEKPMNEGFQARCARVLAGETNERRVIQPRNMRSAHDEIANAQELGLAIVLAPSSNTATMIDGAEAMGGRCVFKQHLGDHWLLIFNLPPDKLTPYRLLASLGATKVTTP